MNFHLVFYHLKKEKQVLKELNIVPQKCKKAKRKCKYYSPRLLVRKL